MKLIPTLVAFGAILHFGLLFYMAFYFCSSYLKSKWQMTLLNQVVISQVWRQQKEKLDTVLFTTGLES